MNLKRFPGRDSDIDVIRQNLIDLSHPKFEERDHLLDPNDSALETRLAQGLQLGDKVSNISANDRMLDATFLSNMSKICAEQGKRLIPQAYSPKAFLKCILRKFSRNRDVSRRSRSGSDSDDDHDDEHDDIQEELPLPESSPDDSDELIAGKVDWTAIGSSVHFLIHSVGQLDTMIGPMDLEKKVVPRRKATMQADYITTQDSEDPNSQNYAQSAMKRTQDTYEEIKKSNGVNLITFASGKESFSHSVEALYDLSTLAFRGLIEMRPTISVNIITPDETLQQDLSALLRNASSGDESVKETIQQHVADGNMSLVPTIECVPVELTRPHPPRNRCIVHIDADQLGLLSEMTSLVASAPSTSLHSMDSPLPVVSPTHQQLFEIPVNGSFLPQPS